MPRPRTPLAKARLTGAAEKHPERYAARAEPQTSGAPVGDPPAHLGGDARAVWIELSESLGWLQRDDRIALEAAALAVGQVRAAHRAGEPVTAALLSAMGAALGRLGATPADRSKVAVQRDDDGDDPFARFDPASTYFS